MYRPYQKIDRRLTRVMNVGNVAIGGNNPIAVQTMTNTLTYDVKKTNDQISRAVKLGVDLVRVSVPDKESSEALKLICKKSKVPIIADIHFHYKRALEAAENGASCLRINPGNIGSDEKVKEVIKAAKNNNASIRIGVNAGSLEKQILDKYSEPNPKALVESAILNMKILEDNDFTNFKISVKASDVFMAMKAYEELSSLCDYPLHLGITEAGSKRTGSIKSSIGIGNLLLQGIGDTIRISLASEPENEVKVGFDILRSLKLRSRGINFIACPSCSRMNFDVIGTMNELERRLEDVSEDLDVAVIGCYVNGPGESKHVSLGVTGASPKNLIYVDGKPDHKIESENLIDHLEALIREKIKKQNKMNKDSLIAKSK